MIVAFLLAGHYPDYAAEMVASVKRVEGCEVVQMSDLKTPAVAGVDRIVRIPFVRPFMVYRFEHIVAFPHDELLLLDSDVIVKRPVRHVFADDFDVALTIRPQRSRVPLHMPYNTGVMFSRGPQFWEDCLNHVLTLNADGQRWYGDQVAVAAIAAQGKHKVKELQCADYNWSPESRDETSNAHIWHYKGAPRKQWLKEKLGSNAVIDHHEQN